jgi:hypothetical protein
LHDWAWSVGWAHDGDIGRGHGGIYVGTDGESSSAWGAWAVGDVGGNGMSDGWLNHSDKGHNDLGAHLGAGAVPSAHDHDTCDKRN